MDDYGNELHFADQWHGITTFGVYGYVAHGAIFTIDWWELMH